LQRRHWSVHVEKIFTACVLSVLRITWCFGCCMWFARMWVVNCWCDKGYRIVVMLVVIHMYIYFIWLPFLTKNIRTKKTELDSFWKKEMICRFLPLADHPCAKCNSGCTHLCLLKPTGYHCACPTVKEDERPCTTLLVTQAPPTTPCTVEPCENNATCEVFGKDYKCLCVGYYGAKNCSVDFSKLKCCVLDYLLFIPWKITNLLNF